MACKGTTISVDVGYRERLGDLTIVKERGGHVWPL